MADKKFKCNIETYKFPNGEKVVNLTPFNLKLSDKIIIPPQDTINLLQIINAEITTNHIGTYIGVPIMQKLLDVNILAIIYNISRTVDFILVTKEFRPWLELLFRGDPDNDVKPMDNILVIEGVLENDDKNTMKVQQFEL